MKKSFLILMLLSAFVNFSDAQNPIFTQAGYGANYSTDGAYLGWNISGGGGETNFVNNIGGGTIGGFTFDNTTRSNAVTHLMSILGNGNVGIGTTNPQTLLHIKNLNGRLDYLQISKSGTSSNLDVYSNYNGSDDVQSGTFGYGVRSVDQAWQIWERHTGIDWHNLVTVKINGNVGIGTSSPTRQLEIVSGAGIGPLKVAGPNGSLLVDNVGSGESYYQANSFHQFQGSSGAPLMTIFNSGSIGIGTTNPGSYRLAVNGGIHSQSVNVDLTGWSDYVFKPGYQLPSLAEVKNYIGQNRHLPDIPSEQEVIKNGVNLGEMNKLLTKKVEELTLYLIDKDKQIQEQNARLSRQECENKSQQEQIDQLKKQLTAIAQSLNKK